MAKISEDGVSSRTKVLDKEVLSLVPKSGGWWTCRTLQLHRKESCDWHLTKPRLSWEMASWHNWGEVILIILIGIPPPLLIAPFPRQGDPRLARGRKESWAQVCMHFLLPVLDYGCDETSCFRRLLWVPNDDILHPSTMNQNKHFLP